MHGSLPGVFEGFQVPSEWADVPTDLFPETFREVVIQHAGVADNEEEKQHSVAIAPVVAFLVIWKYCCQLCKNVFFRWFLYTDPGAIKLLRYLTTD